MPDDPARSLVLTASVLLTGLGLAGTARAELPEPADFTVDYFVTDETGALVRTMNAADHANFLNRARCECGQQVGVQLGIKSPPVDKTTRLDTFVGTHCPTAESAVGGQFRPCGVLASELVPTYEKGILATFHPAFLIGGIAPSSPTRDVSDPETRLAYACGDTAGEAGVWMCKPQENNTAGCQPDEFFLGASDAPSSLSGVSALAFDFQPPLLEPNNLSATPGDGAVELRWDVPTSGDIHGFRVLCEEASGGASPGLGFPTPDITAENDGSHYFTAGNLCGGQPFFDAPVLAPEATPAACGNGVVEPGEACDDGHDNSADGLCGERCDLLVSPSLHALDWDHVCSDHIPFNQESVVVGGLDNGVAYNFVLVAHDRMGNPRAHHRIVTATPDAAAPELLPAEPGCGCTTSPPGNNFMSMFLGTLLLFSLRRRR